MVVLHSLALARVRYAPVLTARTVVPPRFARYPALPPSCRCSHTHADTELARILASPPFLTPLSRALPSGRACKESRLTSSRARIPALCPRTVLSWILVTRRAISRAPCPCQCSHCSIHGDCKDRTLPALPPPRQCHYTEPGEELARTPFRALPSRACLHGTLVAHKVSPRPTWIDTELTRSSSVTTTQHSI